MTWDDIVSSFANTDYEPASYNMYRGECTIADKILTMRL